MQPLIPTPTKKELQQFSFHSENPTKKRDSRVVFVPHAAISYSGHAALESFSTCIPNPSHIWIIGTNHRPQTANRNSRRRHGFSNTNEHSININAAILNFLYPDAQITPWLNHSSSFLRSIVEFLKHPRHIVVFTSDMSHENNTSSQNIIDKEANFLAEIMDITNYTPFSVAQSNRTNSFISAPEGGVLNENWCKIPDVKNISMCGPANFTMFIRVLRSIGEYPIIRCYDDSKEKRNGWSVDNAPYLVSYLSMVSTKNRNMAKKSNETWLLYFHKAFVLSSIKNQLLNEKIPITMPHALRLNTRRGLFITIKWGSQTRACIGRWDGNLYDNIERIIPELIEDAQNRWGVPLKTDEKYTCEFSIMDDKEMEVKEVKGKNHMYMIRCKNGSQCTFIPSVWKEHPEWTPEKYIDELKRKGNCGKNEPYRLFMIKTRVI